MSSSLQKKDLLEILPISKWALLRDSLKRSWPKYIFYYNWMNNAIKWKEKEPQLPLDIFCPNSHCESGVFIGISSYAWYTVILFAFEECKDLLRKVLLKTQVIDWNQYISFLAVHQYLQQDIMYALDEKKIMNNIEISLMREANLYFKPKQDCAEVEYTIPEECYLRHLDSTDIPFIYSMWTCKSVRKDPDPTLKLLETIVRLNRGVGLFLKEDDSLVSWVLHRDWGSLGMLETVEKHKRKGFGKIVGKAIMRELAVEENLDSTLYVIKNNSFASKLYESLGYECLSSATWYDTWPLEPRTK